MHLDQDSVQTLQHKERLDMFNDEPRLTEGELDSRCASLTEALLESQAFQLDTWA